MAQLIYQINTGVPNFTASINPVMKPNQIHSSLGVYSFDDIPNGVYSLTVVDANGCIAFIDNIILEGTTTTTTSSSTTSTTSSTTSTTSTTTTTSTPIEGINYGVLYNGFVVRDVRNVANTGWSVPTQVQYQALADYLGAGGDYVTNNVGDKLKEIGTTYWNATNNGTNEVNFNGRGSGSRTTGGIFGAFKIECALLTSTARNVLQLFVAELANGTANFLVWRWTDNEAGQPIRLIKDSTSLTNGQTGTYTGNDGKVYRTICIGTQEITADCIAETKYRNGDIIPEVTNGTTWSTLTTGALCAYNNDWVNV